MIVARCALIMTPTSGNADTVMERGFLLPCNHGMGDADVAFVLDQLEGFLATR